MSLSRRLTKGMMSEPGPNSEAPKAQGLLAGALLQSNCDQGGRVEEDDEQQPPPASRITLPSASAGERAS